MLSEAVCRLAGLAPTLKEAELRVLLHLVGEAARTGSLAVRASSRTIADAAGCERRNVQRALDGLASRGLIATRAGSPTKAATYLVRFLEVVSIGGVTVTPPPGAGGVEEVASLRLHPGVVLTPPPTDSKALAVSGLRDSISRGCSEVEVVLDRVLKSKPSDFPAEMLKTARGWLHGIVKHLAREDRHPPDDRAVAQFLAVAEWPRLEHMLSEMVHERVQPGASWAWFVTVALQRVHHIRPEVTREYREKLRLVRVASPAPALPEAGELAAGVEQLARAKAMGRRR